MPDAERHKIIEANSYYTKNEKQKKALKLAKEMETTFFTAEKEGFLSTYEKKEISNVTSLLEIRLDDEIKQYCIMVNYRRIMDY
ncbi:hypothetical protein U1E44_00270 [Arenibacter sp. GZD96]|uniref:hypothetical protein n=1 Tax=Aurantibrevibacter litoralis TaxID=3106030 RepID=UPI002AFEDF21|nr:hypothetical protein [Arenibacter sp. GZD-96]MEA1784513.1 hypothetical protein [Arenibacter sp. GZD-96]